MQRWAVSALGDPDNVVIIDAATADDATDQVADQFPGAVGLYTRLAERIEVTIPAFAADTLGESLTVRAPEAWHDRIRALSPRCQYGENYSRQILALLAKLDANVRDGYTTAAYDSLLKAEEVAGL